MNDNDYCKSCDTPVMYPQNSCPKCGTVNLSNQVVYSDNHILRKPVVLTIMSIGMAFVINFLFLNLLGIRLSSLGVLSGLITGSIYTNKFKEIMPKNIRIKAAIYYGVLAYLIATFIILTTMQDKMFNNMNFHLLAIGITGLEALGFYWLLRKGGETEAKRIEKQMQMDSDQVRTNRKNAAIILTIIAVIIGVGFFAAISLDNQNKTVNDKEYIEKEPHYNKQQRQKANKHSGIDFNPFMANLQKKIKSNWNPPRGQKSKRVIVLFKLTKDGNLISSNIKQSSGNQDVDQAALEAVKKSAPFDSLPAEYDEEDIDIQFTFDYNVFRKQ